MNLQQKLEAGQFVITGELAPPKGTDVSLLKEHALLLKDQVDAVNITDNQRSIMKLSSLACCLFLKECGVEPVLQITCRDRNRIGLQSDLLSASTLGLRNVLALTGDPVRVGDHKNAKSVFDWNSIELIHAISGLNQGIDSEGHPLKGKTDLFIGGAICPESHLEPQIARLKKKVDAGVQFIQTQVFFDMKKFSQFMEQASKLNLSILAGILLLKSAKMARFLNKSVPGIHVPENLIEELEASQDPMQTGIRIAARQMHQCRNLCQGVHLMTVGAEERIPEIIQAEKKALQGS